MVTLVMSCTGKVQNGVVVLPPGVKLPEGAEVESIAGDVSPEQEVVLRETAEAYPTITGLPDDLAANHDYYLYGLSKQQPRRGRWIPADQPTPELGDSEAAVATEFLLRLASETSNLPSDLATNHDHYLHGRPKE